MREKRVTICVAIVIVVLFSLAFRGFEIRPGSKVTEQNFLGIPVAEVELRQIPAEDMRAGMEVLRGILYMPAQHPRPRMRQAVRDVVSGLASEITGKQYIGRDDIRETLNFLLGPVVCEYADRYYGDGDPDRDCIDDGSLEKFRSQSSKLPGMLELYRLAREYAR